MRERGDALSELVGARLLPTEPLRLGARLVFVAESNGTSRLVTTEPVIAIADVADDAANTERFPFMT